MAPQLAYACHDPLTGIHADTDPYLDKIGGIPVLPSLLSNPELFSFLVCPNHHPLLLIAQLWAKSTSHYDRFLYIFGCNNVHCSSNSSSWKVFRCIRPAAPVANLALKQDAFKKEIPAILSTHKSSFNFGSDSINQWDDENEPGPVTAVTMPAFESISTTKSDSNLFNSQKESVLVDMLALLKLRNENYIKPHSSHQSPIVDANVLDMTMEHTDSITPYCPIPQSMQDAAFPAFSLEFDTEPNQSELFDHELRLLQEYQSTNPSDAACLARFTNQKSNLLSKKNPARDESSHSSALDEWAGEQYESMGLGVDKLFKRFQRTVTMAPEQCIRYEFKGSPLWYQMDTVQSQISSNHIPLCEKCGGNRVFECQLMPNILSILSVDTHQSVVNTTHGSNETSKELYAKLGMGMDYGSVYIFVCENDCDGSNSSTDGKKYTLVSEYVVVQADTTMKM
ncbi:hypothetical protein O5D80_001749 [Batrachochytrium dendrobatidis]|nr:hypothetical protein O5D80_001749 [Batrachochytrium dendrobatidis]